MDINLWKVRKKELNLTFEDLSKITGLSVRTLKGLFSGERNNATTFTVEAIEKALGLQNEKAPLQLSNGEQKLIELFRLVPQDQQDLVLSMINGAIESLNNN